VNTTSGTVGWRDRFLGLLHSPYQPTEPALFHEMLERLILEARINVEQFTFVDVGSGKGRTLLMASDYPFQRIVGVELLPSLHQAAQQNIAAYRSEKQKCFAVESVCADASDFEFPPCAMIVYLFNPLPQHALIRMLGNLQASLEGNSNFKDCFLLYHNPLLEQCLIGTRWLEKIIGTQQFAVYRSRQSRDSYHQNR
jgi:SAM-dependent methyltransferase